MDYTQVVLKALEEVVGIEQDEMKEELDLPLFEEGLLDSLSFAALIAHIESQLNMKINMRDLTPEDFKTVRSMANTLEKLN